MQPKIPSAMLFRQLFDRTSCTFTYLLADLATRDAVLIDPVDTQIERDLTLLTQHDLTLRYALNTHAHADHISATGLLKRRLSGVRSVIGKASGAKADVLLEDGDVVEVGDVRLTCMYTPGHTEGCVSYLMQGEDGEGGMVFTGDALLVRGCGRTDFQGGDSQRLYRSVREGLFSLKADTEVYPAHDYRGHLKSTIGEEKRWNPRLGEGKSVEDFVKIMDGLGLSYPKMMDKAVPANMNCGIQPE